MIIWWRFRGLPVELSTGWRVWMILLVPVTSPSLWPHWRAFSQATTKSYFSNECWCFWIEHGMVIFLLFGSSQWPPTLWWQQLKRHLAETERVEKVNSFHFHHHTADGILWSPTCSSTLAPFQNMLLINNISRNQYNYCLQIILNSTAVSTDRCVRSATNRRQPCTSVCWRPTPHTMLPEWSL